MIATWNICTRDKANLSNFAFQLYDVQGRGELGLADVRLLLSELFGQDFETKPVSKELMKKMIRFDYKGTALDAHVNIKQFMDLTLASPLMLYPAFELQRKIQERVMGIRAWEAVTKRREKGARDGSFDINNVAAIVNDGKSRRASMVPVDGRHFMSVAAAMEAKGKVVIAGLQRSTKVTAEADYIDLTPEEAGPSLAEKIKAAAEAAAKDPTGTAAAIAAKAAAAVKDGAVSVASTAVSVAKATADTLSVTGEGAARRASIAQLEALKAADRRASAAGPPASPVPEGTSQGDLTTHEMASYIARRRASAAGDNMYGRRNSAAGTEADSAAGRRASVTRRNSAAGTDAGHGSSAAAARRASATGMGGVGGGRRQSVNAVTMGDESLTPASPSASSANKRGSIVVRTIPADDDGEGEARGGGGGGAAPAAATSLMVNRRGSVSGATAVSTSAFMAKAGAAGFATAEVDATGRIKPEELSPSAVEADTSTPLEAPRGERRGSVAKSSSKRRASVDDESSGQARGGGGNRRGSAAAMSPAERRASAVKEITTANAELISRAIRRASVYN